MFSVTCLLMARLPRQPFFDNSRRGYWRYSTPRKRKEYVTAFGNGKVFRC